ncbi:CinA family protein [candidate division KSB1 bacterium]|nr:CinA family protein [candidate division KSB1 bacterium]
MNDQFNHLVTQCINNNKTLATAESCTGGWIAKCITDVAGSSQIFLGGVVAYSNALKQSLLNVTVETLETFGAVSEQTVNEMVVGVCRVTNASVGVAVSGIAGPGGAVAGKPVGTVYIGVGNSTGQNARRFQFAGDRDAVRWQAVQEAMRMILEWVENK